MPPNQINRLLSCNFAVMQVGSGSFPICLLIPPACGRASSVPQCCLAQPPAVEQVAMWHVISNVVALDKPGYTDGPCAMPFWQHRSRAALQTGASSEAGMRYTGP